GCAATIELTVDANDSSRLRALLAPEREKCDEAREARERSEIGERLLLVAVDDHRISRLERRVFFVVRLAFEQLLGVDLDRAHPPILAESHELDIGSAAELRESARGRDRVEH